MTEHALLSASSANRWLHCPPAAVAAKAYDHEETEYTQEGHLAHVIAQLYAYTVPAAKMEQLDADELTKELRQSYNENPIFAEDMLKHGAAYSGYIQECVKSSDAVLLVEQKVDYSEYALGGFGTADAILLQGEQLTIFDYKYGRGVPVTAKENPQLMLYALGALADFDFIYDINEAKLVIYQPRLNVIDEWLISVNDLRKWGEAVKDTAAIAAKGEGEYTPGKWCQFCPHTGKCTALARYCLKTIEVTGVGVVNILQLAPFEVADILQREGQISAWLKAVKQQAIKDLLAGNEIPGFKVVEGRGSRNWSDQDKVINVLTTKGWTKDEYTKTELLSPYQIEQKIGKKQAKELLSEYVVSVPGAPTVAPETDKRSSYNPADAFTKLD